MQIVPLHVWYPSMDAKWTNRRRIAWSDRTHWVHHHTVGGTGIHPLTYARQVADQHWRLWSVPGGYNVLVGTDGVLREMCGLDYQGVHSGTHEWNRRGVAVSYQGDFRSSPPSDVMLDAARSLIAAHPLAQTTHRAVRPTPTSCPGDALIRLLPLEDDMPSPKDWTAEDWKVWRQQNLDSSVGAQIGGAVGSPNRKPMTHHLLEIKAMVGALDAEGVSEAELDQRVDHLIEILPDRFADRLRDRLG